MGHPCARRPREDMARADLNRLLLFLVLEDGQRRWPEFDARGALEEDEELLVGGMAVRRGSVVAGLEAAVVDPGVLRAGLAREQHPAAGLALVGRVGVGEVDGAWWLRVAGVERRWVRRRREQQRREPVVAGAEGRRLVRHRIDDAVVGTQPVRAAGDDEEDVFGPALWELDVLARRKLDPPHADGDRTRRLREVGAGHHLIPVGEQAFPQWRLRTVLGTQMTRSMRRSPNGGSFETTTQGISSM